MTETIRYALAIGFPSRRTEANKGKCWKPELDQPRLSGLWECVGRVRGAAQIAAVSENQLFCTKSRAQRQCTVCTARLTF